MSFAPSLQLAAGVSVAQPQEGGVLSPEGEIAAAGGVSAEPIAGAKEGRACGCGRLEALRVRRLVDECRTRIVFDDGVELGRIGDGADA